MVAVTVSTFTDAPSMNAPVVTVTTLDTVTVGVGVNTTLWVCRATWCKTVCKEAGRVARWMPESGTGQSADAGAVGQRGNGAGGRG